MKRQKKLMLLVAIVTTASLFFQGGTMVFGATPAEIQQWLSAHNDYRSRHGVPPVAWSDTVAASAQAWADTCPSSHSSSEYGENIAFASYITSSKNVVDLWYSEEPRYDYKNPVWDPKYGHFTQVVWKNTTEIGCASKTECSGPWANIWVCQYNPPGNITGQFAENVLPPSDAEYGPAVGVPKHINPSN